MSHPPTAEQAAAIATATREVLLRAGAGSGKTTVLVDRYCDLIAARQLGPDQILAFTFTRKAAAQLRERIRVALLKRAEGEPDHATAARLNEAAARIGASWVMTIHGFCQAVVAAHPVAAGIDPDFSVIENLALDKLRNLAFDRALERFLNDESEGPARERTVAAYGIPALRRLVLDSYDELRSHGMSEPVLPRPERADPCEELDRLAAACAELLGSDGYRPDSRNHDKIVTLGEIASRGRQWLADAGPADLLAELEANSFGSRAEGKVEIAELVRTVCRLLHEELSGVDCHRQISALLELYGAEFSAAKADRSALDFDDLQLLAVRLLSENATIGEAYRGRFRQIMVDEFQDTSPVQVSLIEALKGPETEIFKVGDKFQAIYAFRHADLANFETVDRRLRQDENAEVLPLSGNFRSSAAILSAVNELAAGLLPGFPALRVGSAAQGRRPRGGGSGVELILTADQGWEGADPAPIAPEGVPLKRAAEAEALAHRLAQLVADGVPRGDIVVLLRALSQADAYASAFELRGLRPFVVGGRGFWRGREVIDAVALLRAVANPLDEEGLFGALAGPACAASPDALWLLRRAAGRNPIWHAVAQLAGAGDLSRRPLSAPEWLNEVEPVDREAIESLYGSLVALRNDRARLSLTELVEAALTRTGLDLAVAGGPSGAAGLAALRKLSRLAREYEIAEGRDLRGFLDHARMQADRGDEAEAPTAAEGHDGVRIMTMHAAKGLEFPVVAVPELGRRFGGGPNTPTLKLARRPDGDWLVGLELARLGAEKLKLFDCAAIEELAKEEQAAEELRLFYVAMTRAEERLILSGRALPEPKDGISQTTPLIPRLLRLIGIEVTKDGPPPNVERIVFPAAEARDDLDAEFEPAELELRFNWPDPDHRLALADPQSAAVGSERPELATQGLDESLGDTGETPPIEPIPSPPPPLPPLSFTSLLARSGPSHPEGDEEPRWARERRDDELGLDAAGRAFGTAIHSLLERSVIPGVAGRRWRPISDAMIIRALAEQGLGDTGLSRARRQIDDWLSSPLCQAISRPGVSLRAETPLLLRLDAGGDVTLRGWIDLLAEPSDGSVLVVDYKTNRLDGRQADEVAGEYGLQAEIYALAVSRALVAPQVEVAFVMLDAAAECVRLDFGPEELADAEADLIERVTKLRASSSPVWAMDTAADLA